MRTEAKECPSCGEEIKSKTKKCRYCGQSLEVYAPSSVIDGANWVAEASLARSQRRSATLPPEIGAEQGHAVDPSPVEIPKLILIPAGEFLMGSDPNTDPDAYNDEQPQHHLYLPDYYIAKTPVTNAQYAVFVQATHHQRPRHWERGQPPPDKLDHPVVHIFWGDALAYCRWLSAETGQNYRLPTEAEWEKAARGTDGRIYPWGDEFDPEKCNTVESGLRNTTPVDHYSPNGDSPYGVADGAGNIREWTLSIYGDYPYNSTDGRENLAAGNDTLRVLRGGSFIDTQNFARCAARSWINPFRGFDDVGYRIIFSPNAPSTASTDPGPRPSVTPPP